MNYMFKSDEVCKIATLEDPIFHFIILHVSYPSFFVFPSMLQAKRSLNFSSLVFLSYKKDLFGDMNTPTFLNSSLFL